MKIKEFLRKRGYKIRPGSKNAPARTRARASASVVAREKAESQNLRYVGHYRERIGIHFLDDPPERRDLPPVNDADEHGVRLLGVHARRGQRGHAAAQSGDDRQRHFLRLVGDDPEFDGGMEAVGDGVVRLALDELFARRHDEGEDARRRVAGDAVDEEGGGDDETVEEKEHPGDGVGGEFLLHDDGDDVHAPRTAAQFQRDGDRRADADAARQRREDLFVKFQPRHAQPFHQREEHRLQYDVRQGQQGKFFLDEKKGDGDQGEIDTEDGYALGDLSVRRPFQNDGDTRHAAHRKVVGGDQAVGGEGDEKGGKRQKQKGPGDVKCPRARTARGQEALLCLFRGKGRQRLRFRFVFRLRLRFAAGPLPGLRLRPRFVRHSALSLLARRGT